MTDDAQDADTPDANPHGANPHGADTAGADTADADGEDRPGQATDPGSEAGGQELTPHGSPRGHVATMPPGRQRPPRRTGVFLDPLDLRSHVGDLLRAIVGAHRVDAFGNFTFDHQDARVFVTVAPTPLGPIVGIFSITNTDLELDADLASWLARTNHRLLLGTLSWDDDNHAVWLRHNLLGTHIDPPELQAAVQAVASTAVSVGAEIVERFGGARFVPGNDEPTSDAGGPTDGTEAPDGVPPPDFDPVDAAAGPSNTTGYL